MRNPVIPEAAVEAAAKAIHRYDWAAGLGSTYAPTKHHREEARLALEAAAPHLNEPTLGDAVTIERAIEQIDAGEQSVPGNPLANTGLSDAVTWHEVRGWLESIEGAAK